MAVRYAEDPRLTVRVEWDAKEGVYRCSVSNGRRTWRGTVGRMTLFGDPRSSTAYDRAARAAVRRSGMGDPSTVGRVFECPCPGHDLPKRRRRR